MKDFFEKLIDAANAKNALRREDERREADDLARTKADAQRLADACYEKCQPMFDAAVAAMRNRGIAASYERRTTGVLVVFDSLETDAALKRRASSFEYAYFQGSLHVSEVACGSAAVARTLSCSELEPAFVEAMDPAGKLVAALEALGPVGGRDVLVIDAAGGPVVDGLDAVGAQRAGRCECGAGGVTRVQ